ncbi:MAG: hypothetical protein WBO04_15300 [Steroidobacteraceae bacterium]
MVLESSVRKQADRVRVTAQLIDASTGFHLWSETYDRELEDIFAIQDEIERAIDADAGFAEAWGGLAITYAVLPDYSNRLPSRDAEVRSLEAAQRALALQPALAEPYMAMGNVAGKTGRRQSAAALLRRAIELRPSTATAHQWLGTTMVELGEVEQGIASLERADALDRRAGRGGDRRLPADARVCPGRDPVHVRHWPVLPDPR